ncbi:MAG: UDP-2,3-diacylglucosamine diphosphatase [Rhodoferax sp.]|uniref:UDP-2,3-diacylglucosamine diphosphatase n=1 Tax=Rhodoferax sp. TaxID=50421 RepID=UPI00260C44E8|nr:UDP-2,3-diacylglucosamine diphosphatase [Rhodoferax sp.]MDD5334491.1 UDP-2,3-diacylglucosamine diphosphatase [Rhodoferax sp.]
MNGTVPPVTAHSIAWSGGLLQAPVQWRYVDFISDLHLQDGDSATFRVWQDYMRNTRADAVFILGDLFELWVGDDMLGGGGPNGITVAPEPAAGLAARCAQVLETAARRLTIFFMHGNRDFLLGPAYAKASGMTLIDDPCVLEFAGQRWLLSHGDALCLADTDYMQFRTHVRSARWRQEFLARPLSERLEMGRALRQQSEARKSKGLASGMALVDLDTELVCDWLRTARAGTLIHGHTHKPAEHDLENGLRRIVLSDWDASATPARASVLRLSAVSQNQVAGASVERIAAALA